MENKDVQDKKEKHLDFKRVSNSYNCNPCLHVVVFYNFLQKITYFQGKKYLYKCH